LTDHICRTASVYFPNGTIANIAKIEGSPSYKHILRSLEPKELSDVSKPSYPSKSSKPPQYQTVLSAYLPHWISRSLQRAGWAQFGTDPAVAALAGMIKALRIATESFLEDDVLVADLAIPFRVTESSRSQLRAACRSLGLQNALPGQPPAGLLAAMINDLDSDCSEHPTLVLAVDYSQAALTAVIMSLDCGVFENHRTLHETTLGAAALQDCQLGQNQTFCQELLAAAVRSFLQMPLEDETVQLPDKISALVLLGESATDHLLHSVLKEALKEQYEIMVGSDISSKQSLLVDPLFAASGELARATWIRQDNPPP
jgi:hypothetical protein